MNKLWLPLLLVTAITLPNTSEAGLWSQILGEPAHPKVVVVLVDLSGSPVAEDWHIYDTTFNGLLQQVCPGDRVILAPIADRPSVRFSPVADMELPASGIRLNDEEARTRSTRDLLNAFMRLKVAKRERTTPIIETISLIGPMIAADESRAVRWIVLLSDGRQDSRLLNLDRETLTADRTHTFISRMKRLKTLPELTGAKVFVAGAAAPTLEKFTAIRQFWEQFFLESGASLLPGGYVRNGLRFPAAENGGCS